MRRPDRILAIFSISALDVVAMALGVFVLLVVVLLPYFRNTLVANEDIENLRAAASEEQASVDAALHVAAAEAAAAAELNAEAEEAVRAAAELRAATAKLVEETRSAEGRGAEAERRMDEMRAAARKQVIRELDLVFVVDTTASMGPAIHDLTVSMASIVRVLERLVPSVRVGFVAYRDHDVPGYLTKALPLTPTLGDGLQTVLDFVAALRPAVSGPTVREAMYAGLQKTMALPFRPTAKQTLIVIGDAAAHRRVQGDTLALARNFKASGPRRSLSVLFVPTPSYLRFGQEDREFFAELAHAGGGVFNDHAGQMIESVLVSVLD